MEFLTDIAEFVRKCDEEFKKRLYSVADKIALDKNVKIVSLAGPTCSGKTTAANMLLKRLSENNIKGHIISIDDFFFDQDELIRNSLKKGLKRPDYESIDAIDFVALKIFVEEIFSSSEVHCPVFDFQRGERVNYKSLKINNNDVFIFEGIQSIYPEVTRVLEAHGMSSVYIAPLMSLEFNGKMFCPNDIRLMRRIVRDYNFRGSSPEMIFDMWEGVRTNEEKNIFPYVESCVYHIDSTMQYELGILAPFLKTILSIISKDSPFYERAKNILLDISDVKAISPSFISEDSLYKEFV